VPAGVVDSALASLVAAAIGERYRHRRRQLALPRRHRAGASLAASGIHYIDMGTSGGVWGIERGYCLMIGGEA
jgi:6-phosphogluconate dehydrogenase